MLSNLHSPPPFQSGDLSSDGSMSRGGFPIGPPSLTIVECLTCASFYRISARFLSPTASSESYAYARSPRALSVGTTTGVFQRIARVLYAAPKYKDIYIYKYIYPGPVGNRNVSTGGSTHA